MNRARKLLFVVNDAAFFLSHRLPIARAARAAGFEVHVATPRDAQAARIEKEGLTFHPIALNRRGRNPWCELRSLIGLYRLYRALRPDLVHHVTNKPILYGGIAARLAGVGAVVNAISGLGYLFISRSPWIRILRSLLKHAYRIALGHPNGRVIFQNPEDRDLFVRNRLVTPERTVIIKGSGVDLERYAPSPERAPPVVVVLAARILWDKGVGEFVEAARLLKADGVMARFVLVGDLDSGNPASVTADEIAAWVNEGTVEWWGRSDDMPSVFAQAHIACLPSYREGLPKVLIEACACARPIVTTDVPGCRDVVHHGENGLLIPVRNPRALAEALRSLIHDGDQRRRLGQRCREIAEHEFSDKDVATRTLALYEELFHARG